MPRLASQKVYLIQSHLRSDLKFVSEPQLRFFVNTLGTPRHRRPRGQDEPHFLFPP
jgi:hypothetical protein